MSSDYIDKFMEFKDNSAKNYHQSNKIFLQNQIKLNETKWASVCFN